LITFFCYGTYFNNLAPNLSQFMKYFYVLLLCCVIPAAVFSQTNFQKGYIIKSAGDTVRGYLDYQEWNKNPLVVNFKIASDEKSATNYKPEDLRGFSVDGYDLYRSYQCKISTGVTEGTELSTGVDTATIRAQVFLKVLVDGAQVKLYDYRDEIKSRYFIQEKNGYPVELEYAVFYNAEENQRKMMSIEKYKTQLAYLAQNYAPDDVKIISKIRNVDYNEGQIVEIVNLIDNIDNRIATRGHKKTFRFFAGGGVSFTQTNFSGLNLFSASKSGNSTTPIISAGADFFSNPHVQRLILRGEFLFSWINPTFQASDNTGAQYAATIKQYTFTFLPQVIYNFYNTEKVKVYVGAGFGTNFSSYSNRKYGLIYEGKVVGGSAYDLAGYWLTFPVEAGLVLNKRIDIMARYSFPSSYSHYIVYSINNTGYQLTIHYLFGKKY
jgi:hypothetical protein